MFSRRIWVALTVAASAPYCHAEAADSVSSLYFYPPLSDATTREIDWTSASSVVSEVVGISQGLSQILPIEESPLLEKIVKELGVNVLDKPKANLYLVVEDFPNDKTMFDRTPAFEINGDVASGDALLGFGARVADLSADVDANSWPIIITADQSLVGYGPAARVTIHNRAVKDRSAGLLPEGLEQTIKEVGSTTFVNMEAHAVESFGKKASVYKIHQEEDAQFLGEMEFLGSFFEALFIQQVHDGKKIQAIPTPKFLAINLSGLRGLRARYGEASAQYRTGAEITATVVEQIASRFSEIHKSNVLVEVLALPPSASATLSRRASTLATTTCATSEAACISAFANCTSHGACVPKTNANNVTCYTCQCNKKWTDDNGKAVKGFSGPVTWTGDSCQYQDISVSFQIIFWSSVSLIVTLIFVVGLIASVGGSDQNKDGAGSGNRSKTD